MIELREDSPVFHLGYGDFFFVQFQTYSVAPSGQQWGSERKLFSSSLRDLRQTLSQRSLGATEELSLTSRVTDDRGYRFGHIPMVDLAGPELPDEWPWPQGSEFNERRVHYWRTGRAAHAYWDGGLLATDAYWQKFLGELLCCKAPDGSPLVDVRSVGYALRRGYSALRLTKNTDRYLQAPERAT